MTDRFNSGISAVVPRTSSFHIADAHKTCNVMQLYNNNFKNTKSMRLDQQDCKGMRPPFNGTAKVMQQHLLKTMPGGNEGAAGRWSPFCRPHSPSWAWTPSPPGYRGARSRRGLGVRCYLPRLVEYKKPSWKVT